MTRRVKTIKKSHLGEWDDKIVVRRVERYIMGGMQDEATRPRLFVDRKGVGGEWVEQVFYGDSLRQIAKFWGKTTLEEVANEEQLVIPSTAQETIEKMVIATKKDGRERGCCFGVEQSGRIVVRDRRVGEDSVFDLYDGGEKKEIGASIRISSNWWLVDDYLGEGQPLNFHTHPSLDSDRGVSAKGTTDTGKQFELSMKALKHVFEFVTATFSGADLAQIEVRKRLVNSTLLASESRICYLCPRHPHMDFLSVSQDYEEYEVKLNALSGAFMLRVAEVGSEIFAGEKIPRKKERQVHLTQSYLGRFSTEEEFVAERDRLLKEFADKVGYSAFVSSREDRHILVRL